MLILQMPPRSVSFEGQALPTFPAPTTIIVELGPAEAFGEGDLTGKLSTVPWGHTVQMSVDLRNGGIRFAPGGRLPTLASEGEAFGVKFTFRGRRLTIEHETSSEPAFRRLIELVEHQVPALLAASLRAPIEIVSFTGTVGASRFRVEVTGVTEAPLRTLDLGSEVKKKLGRLDGLPADDAARVFSAHRYLLQAHRLRYASEYPAQFVGERLLNLCKVLEVLFGRLTEDLRAQLKRLDLRPELIELLVGLVYVRDESDVGHPAIRHLDTKNYETVQRYVIWLEEVITWLLDHLVDRLVTTPFRLTAVGSSKSKRVDTLALVAEKIALVNPLQPDTFLTTNGGGDAPT
jgi:hypothetical protein